MRVSPSLGRFSELRAPAGRFDFGRAPRCSAMGKSSFGLVAPAVRSYSDWDSRSPNSDLEIANNLVRAFG